MMSRFLLKIGRRSHSLSAMTDRKRVTLDFDDATTREQLLPECRLKPGEIWRDPEDRHVIGCGDATDRQFVESMFDNRRATLALHDPPYNMVAFQQRPVAEYIGWCRSWVSQSFEVLNDHSSLYIWLGADQKNHFQPLPQFMAMMVSSGFQSRSFITLRNQRGYGTQKNWMAVRQELLYYTKGEPSFEVQYTDIPKILRGYYKDVGGERTENMQRSRSDNIRPGNVWVDTQQVFYRLEENVNGCYAQKPLKAIERIVMASSSEGDIVADFFSHSGTTVLACERLGRKAVTFDIDPIYAEITIRRLEHFRQTGKTGWQMGEVFGEETHRSAEEVVVGSVSGSIE